jgi:hypothetical protein
MVIRILILMLVVLITTTLAVTRRMLILEIIFNTVQTIIIIRITQTNIRTIIRLIIKINHLSTLRLITFKGFQEILCHTIDLIIIFVIT